jgi:hypothetical protein
VSERQRARLAPYYLIVSLAQDNVFAIDQDMRDRFPHLKRGMVGDPGDFILHREDRKLFISFIPEHEDYAIEVALLWGDDLVKRRG